MDESPAERERDDIEEGDRTMRQRLCRPAPSASPGYDGADQRRPDNEDHAVRDRGPPIQMRARRASAVAARPAVKPKSGEASIKGTIRRSSRTPNSARIGKTIVAIAMPPNAVPNATPRPNGRHEASVPRINIAATTATRSTQPFLTKPST